MDAHGFVSDNLDRRGFISKQDILEAVSQEEIFELVFGFIPQEFVYITSPFRPDRRPGAWFEYMVDGKLLFKDFGSPGKKKFDCFDAVQIFFRLPNFYTVLEFIHDRLVKGKTAEPAKRIERQIAVFEEREKTKILVETRDFAQADADFWYKRYKITKENLIEDKVFPFVRTHILNSKSGSFTKMNSDIGYAFMDFPQGRKKLYFPYREGKDRFISTCTKDDIGGLRSLPLYGRQLIITKSYKDWRVLSNKGKSCVWFQNEGMLPKEELLVDLGSRYSNIIVWFDNDAAGIQASLLVRDAINRIYPRKAKPLWLPENLNPKGISDPSDLLHRKGEDSLIQFLKQFT